MKKFLEKRFRVVAYNNRTYKGYKFATQDVFTKKGARTWLVHNADFDRYVYDLLDIKTNKFEINYQPMIDDFEYIKKVIKNKNNTGYHSEYIEKLMFNFKSKWDIRVGKMATKIYFEDLCAVFNSVEILVGC